ncbi:MAG: heavy-metal-associated domain-containing protein [Chitinophagaceae bacterium]
MKKIIIALFCFISINASAQFVNAELQASGLTCSMCSKAIYKALEKVIFVESIDSDIKTSTYKIKFKKDLPVSFDELKKAVTNAGFSVAQLKVKTVFNNLKIENDSHVQLGGNTLHFMNVKNQVLNGQQMITIVDKDFIPGKDYKKYSKLTAKKCYESGKMESCCTKNSSNKVERVYHTTI